MTVLEDLACQLLIREAKRGAARLRFKLAYPISEQEDLSQDLLLDLLRRLPRYDPARGGLGAFAGVVMSNRCRSIAATVRKGRRREGHRVPLDSQVDGKDRRPLADVIPEAASLWNWTGQTPSDLDRTLAIASVLGHLTPEDLLLYSELARDSAADLIGSGRHSRSGLYRRIARLRLVFAAFGLEGRTV